MVTIERSVFSANMRVCGHIPKIVPSQSLLTSVVLTILFVTKCMAGQRRCIVITGVVIVPNIVRKLLRGHASKTDPVDVIDDMMDS